MKIFLVLIGMIGCLMWTGHTYAWEDTEEHLTHIQPQADTTTVFMNRLESDLIKDLSRQGVKGNLRIELIGEQQEILKSFYYGNADLNQVKIVNVNQNNGYFSALAEILPRNLGRVVTVQLQGQYEDVVFIPSVKNKVLKDSIITSNDITLLQKDSRQIRGDVIVRSEDLIGKMAKRNIMPGKPISARVVSEPVLVKKGEHVTISYDTPAILLRTIGIALSDGERGALIPIRNISSNVVVHAKVLGKGEVAIPSVIVDDEKDDYGKKIRQQSY